MAFRETDSGRHKFWLSVEFLKVYVEKNLEPTILFVNFANAFYYIHREKIEQILFAYDRPKEPIGAIMMIYRNMKVKVRFPDEDTDYFDIVAGVLQWEKWVPYLFIICLDYVLRTSIDKMKNIGFKLIN